MQVSGVRLETKKNKLAHRLLACAGAGGGKLQEAWARGQGAWAALKVALGPYRFDVRRRMELFRTNGGSARRAGA